MMYLLWFTAIKAQHIRALFAGIICAAMNSVYLFHSVTNNVIPDELFMKTGPTQYLQRFVIQVF